MEVSSSHPLENDFISRCFPEFLTEADVETEFAIDEEMIEEVMQELYKEITSPAASTCSEAEAAATVAVTKEAQSLAVRPPSPLPSMSLSAKVFVESGKSSESCGASVSDSASSVMAGVEFAGGVVGSAGRESVGDVALMEEEDDEEMLAGERDMMMMMEMEGCDGVEFGDECWSGFFFSF